jgi:predicted O-methyltransferase YrrM
MSNRTLAIDDRIYSYLLSASLREPAVLQRLREETASDPHSNMQIAPEQGQFMALLVELLGVKHALEIGTFTGYSALSIALAMPEGGRLLCCDISDEWTAIARRYWKEAGVENKIELRLAPALATLDGLLETDQTEPFDFAFIDADKENYEAYYERCLRLIRPGGLIAADNTLWDGAVADPHNNEGDTQAIRAFNRKLLEDTRIALSLVPIGDGVTLARKR